MQFMLLLLLLRLLLLRLLLPVPSGDQGCVEAGASGHLQAAQPGHCAQRPQA
jgi:hypothetical protein